MFGACSQTDSTNRGDENQNQNSAALTTDQAQEVFDLYRQKLESLDHEKFKEMNDVLNTVLEDILNAKGISKSVWDDYVKNNPEFSKKLDDTTLEIVGSEELDTAQEVQLDEFNPNDLGDDFFEDSIGEVTEEPAGGRPLGDTDISMEKPEVFNNLGPGKKEPLPDLDLSEIVEHETTTTDGN